MARRSPPIEQFNLNATVAANFARPPMDNGELAIAAGRAVAHVGDILSKLAAAGEARALDASVQAASDAGSAAAAGTASTGDAGTSGGDYFARLRQIESGGNDRAVNQASGAAGRYQFIPSTAKAYGITDPFDVAQQETAVRRLTDANRAALTKALGRAPTDGELYLAHQQGAGGAIKLLGNPDAVASSLVGERAVTLNGGKPDMTAGQFASLWTSKLQGAPSAAAIPGIRPLQLRHDGTPQGAAYDTALVKAGAYNARAAMTTGLAAISEQFKDDPAGFEKAAGKLQQQYVQAFAQVPELQATAGAEFLLQYEPVRRQVYDRRDAAANKAAQDASAVAVVSQGDLLEQQAYATGVNADGDARMSAIMSRAMTLLDGAVAQGGISPEEGAKKRGEFVNRLLTARFDGVFDALKTVPEKQAFAEQLRSPEMKDRLLGQVSLKQYDDLSARYVFRARNAGNTLDASARIEKEKFKSTLASDLASMTATGQGVKVGGSDIDAGEVARVLGPEAAQKWADDRSRSFRLWAASDGLDRMTPEQMRQRLDAVTPKAGAIDFKDQQSTFAAVQARIADIAKRRAADPAAEADKAFPEVAALRQAFDPKDPQTVGDLIAGRLHAQAALGIDQAQRLPLTADEARAIGGQMNSSPEAAMAWTETLVKAAPDTATLVLHQVADDLPGLAVAADLVVKGGSPEALRYLAAQRQFEMAQGGKPERPAAKEAQRVNDLVNETYGPALGGFSMLQQAMPDNAARIFRAMARERGIDATTETPDGSALYERALQVAAGASFRAGRQYGGVAGVNGRQTLIPVDMQPGDVEAALQGISADELKTLPPIVTANTMPVSSDQIAGGQLIAAGDGKYYVALGDVESGDPRYVVGKAGLWVLDIRDLARLQAARQ